MRNIFVTIIVVLSFISAAVSAERPLGVEEFTSVDELAGAIAAYFPKVQGEVNTVQGGRVTITLGRKDGITAGMTLTLWRVAKEILHPVTNAVIGRTEEEVGTIEVSTVAEGSSTAALIKKLKDPRPGDKARITPRKINLTVIPLRSDFPDIVAELTRSLSESGRFSVPDAEKTAEFLKDRKVRDTAMVIEMGRAFNLDAVVALGVYPSEGKLLVTARTFYAEDARPLDTIVAMLDLKARKETLGEIKPFFAPVKEEKSSTPELPFDAIFFATADLDGDGALEHVFSDGSKLHIYRQEPSGWKEVWTESVAAGAAVDIQHISLDVADINANNRPEIFVTAMVRGKIVSFAVEWQEGAYRRIADLPGFLRVVSYPGRGTLLIGQDYDPVAFYSGQPKQYAWSAGKYIAGQAFPLPKGTGLYGWALADFGEPKLFLVALDDDDKIVVYSGDNRVWKSEEEYITMGAVVVKPLTGIDAAVSKASGEADKTRRVKIKGRLLALDMNGDRKDELIIPKNIGSLFSLVFKEAELHGLRWNGARLDDVWSVKEIPGAVVDLHASRREGEPLQVRTLVRSAGGLFTKQTERMILYTVK